MEKKFFSKRMMCIILLMSFILLVCVSSATAQDSSLDKIEQAKQLFSVQLSNVTNEQQSKTNRFFEQCSDSERQAIRAYMVKAITDSLTADNKQFAINYIDYYRMIASPDDEYLGSLVVTEGRYYYDLMDELKLSELIAFLNGIVSKTDLDYSKEVSELNKMMNEVMFGCQDLEGYWVADFSDKEKADPLFIRVYKDIEGKYHVKTDYCSIVNLYQDLSRYGDHMSRIKAEKYYFSGSQLSSECDKTTPTSLSYIWTSEKLNVNKGYLITALRSGARDVSASIIGEMARSNTYSFGTSLLGTTGAVVGEVLLNSLIDLLSVSKKTIKTITGTLIPIDRNNMDAMLFVDVFKLRSDNNGINHDQMNLKIKFVRCQWNDPYVKNKIAFADGMGLRQELPLSKKSRKLFYKSNHMARGVVKQKNWYPQNSKRIRKYNRKQLEILKEYNKTH